MKPLSLLAETSGGYAAPATPETIGLAPSLPARLETLPCHEHDADLWFAEQSRDLERAKAFCEPCPLRVECLAGAIERGEPWGVWGGQILVAGRIVAVKRGRGRPRKTDPSPEAKIA